MSRWFAIAQDMKGGELNKTNSLFPEPEPLMPASTPLRAPAPNKLFDGFNSPDLQPVGPPMPDRLPPADKLFDSFNSPDPLNVQAPDPDALLSYGAAASALGWSATRAWQAEAMLRAAGRIRHDSFGRAAAIPSLEERL